MSPLELSHYEIRSKLVVAAEAWVGTPYHHRAMIKGAGGDCATLLIAVFHELGLIPNISPGYTIDWHMHRDEERYLQWLSRFAGEIALDDIKPGDVLVWRFGRTYSHGAIYVGNGEIIHAYRRAGAVVMGRTDESDLASRPCKAWRIRGLE